MRRIVYLLLAVNLGLLTWNLLTRGPERPSPRPAASAPAPAADQDGPTLPLLAELGKDSLRERANPTSDTGLASAEALTAPAENESPLAQPNPPVGPEINTPPASQSDPPSPVGASLPTNPLSDPHVGAGLPANSRSESPADPTTSSHPPRTCLTLGPLDESAPLTNIQTWLEQRGAEVDVRTDERREVALYWIYFPPAATRRAAVAQVERLRAEGLSDVIVVPKGDMANAISLGVFSRTETRDRRLRELNARGYQPSISPRYRTTLATWMDVSAPEDAISDAEVQARWPELELARKPCPSAQIAATAPASYNPAQPPRPARRFFFSGQAADQPPATPGAR